MWAPLKLNVAAGGHFNAGEDLKDCMREVREEIGREYPLERVTFLGRRLSVTFDTKGRRRQTVVDIALVEDSESLDSYVLQEEEVYAICACPIDDLIRVHTEPDYSFDVRGLAAKKEEISIHVTKDSFPKNWDPCHLKMALLAKRYLDGEKVLIY